MMNPKSRTEAVYTDDTSVPLEWLVIENRLIVVGSPFNTIFSICS
jgi:hypothetical protein